MIDQGFLILAKELNSKGNSEIHQKSSISRSYYAAFHFLRKFITEKMKQTVSDGPGAHGEIVRFLKNSLSEEDLAHADFLVSMKNKRNKADYGVTLDGLSTLKPKAETYLKDVNDLIDFINGLSDSKVNEMKVRLEEYLSKIKPK